MFDSIIIGAVGVVTGGLSSWITWLLSKKKYYSEVKTNDISNMDSALEFYKKLNDDTNNRLEQVLERNAKLE